MPTQRPIAHWLLLASLVFLWGSSFLFIKIALVSFSPEGLVASRLIIAALVLLAVMLKAGRRMPREKRHWGWFVALAVTGNVIPFWLISWGQQGIDSGLSGILMAVMPLTTIVLAHFFVEDEPLNRFRVAGFGLGFAGIIVLMGPETLLELRGQGTSLLYELAVLGGALFYAVNAIIMRRRPKCDSLTASTAVLLIATDHPARRVRRPVSRSRRHRRRDARAVQADRDRRSELHVADQLSHPPVGFARRLPLSRRGARVAGPGRDGPDPVRDPRGRTRRACLNWSQHDISTLR